MPLIVKVLLLAVVQGACELLPVSSSAHVIVAERLMGLDPTSPGMTFLLVMLHTGTMFACIAYFLGAWRERYFASWPAFVSFAKLLVLATACTGVVGLGLKFVIEHLVLRGQGKAEVEQLFGNLTLIAVALACAGLLIVWSGSRASRGRPRDAVGTGDAIVIGIVQGLCLPFRGFSRSGATISTGLLRGLDRALLENFSFALAVVLTPAVIVIEGHRLLKAHAPGAAGADLGGWAGLALLGMAASFVAGWLALKWLSRWLENGRWHLFGYYCLIAAVGVFLAGRVLAAPAVPAAPAASAASAASAAAGVSVTDAWARPTPPGAAAAAVYFSIVNRGQLPDRLLSLSTPVAARAQLHETTQVEGAMTMRPLTALDCPAGSTVRAAPDGVHVMLEQLSAPLVAGGEFPLRFEFRDAGAVTVRVRVEARE